MTDGELTDSTSFEVTITPVNDGPSAVDDTGATDEDSPITVSVLANDTDPDLDQDGDNLLITATSGVDNGSVTVSGTVKPSPLTRTRTGTALKYSPTRSGTRLGWRFLPA